MLPCKAMADLGLKPTRRSNNLTSHFKPTRTFGPSPLPGIFRSPSPGLQSVLSRNAECPNPGSLRARRSHFRSNSSKMVPRINHSLGAAKMRRHRTPILNDAPSIAFNLSDDECVNRLGLLIEHRDNKNFAEIVSLIARLAIPIEG